MLYEFISNTVGDNVLTDTHLEIATDVVNITHYLVPHKKTCKKFSIFR